MLINDLATSGSLPVLERVWRFAGERQKLLVHNIANMDTPDFRPMDVSPGSFRESLARAVEARRQATGGHRGELPVQDTGEVVHGPRGTLSLKPRTASGNILYHDRNNRDLERMMQDLAENSLVYRLTSDFIRRESDLLRTAISQRV